MGFYSFDQGMHDQLRNILDRFEREGRTGLHKNISITWIRYPEQNPIPGSGFGAGWSEDNQIYPASVIKLFYGVAAEAWIQRDLIKDDLETRRALEEMIRNSSNDATSLIIDLLTGTTSGPSLTKEKWTTWQIQRNLIKKWFQSLKWPELEKINCCQKTWAEGPYGRDKDFYRKDYSNRNSLSTSATGRLMEGIMTNSILSPSSCKRLQKLLFRSLDIFQRKEDPENQIDGFLGEGLPRGSKLWSKAGWMSEARHDAAWWTLADSTPSLLVVFTAGKKRAQDPFLLPAIASELSKGIGKIN